MQEIIGYFDGHSIRTSEKIRAGRNQKVRITILDEYMDEPAAVRQPGCRGILSAYADPARQEQESAAWEAAAVEKNSSGCEYYPALSAE